MSSVQLSFDIELLRPAQRPQQRIDAKSDSLKWIRFERAQRFHAVFAEMGGGYWTYCQRFTRLAPGVTLSAEPPARCSCCKSRLRNPYLVPDKLVALRGEA